MIWDVGLGAAANVLTVLRATRAVPCQVRVVSFDHTVEALRFALTHRDPLGYFPAYESRVSEFLKYGRATWTDGPQTVNWELHLGDFPALLAAPQALDLPKPHAIMFDAFSPARNPAMWTLPLFAALHRLLDPARPCAMPTYSRSTLLRVSWLLAGFFVGAGHATGEKEETTIAANAKELISEPLGRRWLERARRSTSAEPLHSPVYRQAPMSEETWERLRAHPQFMG